MVRKDAIGRRRKLQHDTGRATTDPTFEARWTAFLRDVGRRLGPR